MKREVPFVLSVFVLAAFLASARPGLAEVVGDVSGCVTMTDIRRERATGGAGTSGEGSLHRPGAGPNPASNVLVRFRILPPPHDPSDDFIKLPHTFYGRTNDSGCYGFAWSDWTRDSGPVPAEMDVVWAYARNIADPNAMPPTIFSIRDMAGRQLISTRAVTLTGVPPGSTDGSVTTVNRLIASGEAAASYATAREYFARVVEGGNGGGPSSVLIERMRDIEIRIRSNVQGAGQGGVAPTADLLLVSPGIPIGRPSILAHELGHLTTWNALDLFLAPISLQEYGLPDLGWERLTPETTKIAFLEGMADFFMSVWRWNRTSPTPFHNVGGRRHGIEAANWDQGPATDPWTGPGAIPLGNSCAGFILAHERVFCHAASLWDAFDAPATDDDGLHLNIAEIAAILDSYPDDCLLWDNDGCSNETGDAGLNHLDFVRNAEDGDRNRIRQIYSRNGIQNQ